MRQGKHAADESMPRSLEIISSISELAELAPERLKPVGLDIFHHVHADLDGKGTGIDCSLPFALTTYFNAREPGEADRLLPSASACQRADEDIVHKITQATFSKPVLDFVYAVSACLNLIMADRPLYTQRCLIDVCAQSVLAADAVIEVKQKLQIPVLDETAWQVAYLEAVLVEERPLELPEGRLRNSPLAS